MRWNLNALILGVVQGIAELLIISSSAHLILYSSLVGGYTLPISLNIALHFGTLLAVLLFFGETGYRWFSLLNLLFLKKKKSFEANILFPSLVIGTLPAGILGSYFEKNRTNFS